MIGANRGCLLLLLGLIAPWVAQAQIDPIERRLIQVGYNQAFQGRQPIAAYGFYYWNQPQFYATNLTLRLAIAPVYVDSELGISRLFGPNTDLGIGLGGGAFGDSYAEFRGGAYQPKESFYGDGGSVSASIYHLFDPGRLIPLSLIFRATAHQAFYRRDSDTADNFELPDEQTSWNFRTGLRFGGEEPSLTEPLAMEVSVWHEAQIRMEPGEYGFNNDRRVESQSQLIWGRALLKYMLNPSEHMLEVRLTAGTAWDVDRFSAYRLGGILPFTSEFPLILPGYFYQELSAEHFALLNGQYSFPLPNVKSVRFDILGAGGWVDYAPGLELPEHWHAGLGGGMTYISPSGSWLVTLLYGHGFEAMRSHGRGGDQIAFLMQYDFKARGKGKSRFFAPPGAEQMFR